MENEQTNKTDTPGTEDVKAVETAEETTSDLDKLKAHNEELEKELVKGRELKAEAQKLEAEKMLGGDSGGHVETAPVEETNKEYRQRIEKELAEGKHDRGQKTGS